MAVVRENILGNEAVRDKFLEGIQLLDQPNTGITASQLAAFLSQNKLPLRMRGIEQQLSTYDIFVFWHLLAMSIGLPVGNAAHNGPIFLPWHRMYLIRFEEKLQKVLNDSSFGLPYWDWAADGELPRLNQWRTDLWSSAYLGEARGAVRSGKVAEMRVRLVQDVNNGDLISIEPRPIQRDAASEALRVQNLDLPSESQVQSALDQTIYDQPPWNMQVLSHRNVLEGWHRGPALHNLVHVWVGGDMLTGTSPNDPAFFLNHCNVDRIWELWMARHGRSYRPEINRGPAGHRINSTMLSIVDDELTLGKALTPGDVLNPSQWYTYDR